MEESDIMVISILPISAYREFAMVVIMHSAVSLCRLSVACSLLYPLRGFSLEVHRRNKSEMNFLFYGFFKCSAVFSPVDVKTKDTFVEFMEETILYHNQDFYKISSLCRDGKMLFVVCQAPLFAFHSDR